MHNNITTIFFFLCKFNKDNWQINNLNSIHIGIILLVIIFGDRYIVYDVPTAELIKSKFDVKRNFQTRDAIILLDIIIVESDAKIIFNL